MLISMPPVWLPPSMRAGLPPRASVILPAHEQGRNTSILPDKQLVLEWPLLQYDPRTILDRAQRSKGPNWTRKPE
jgi:hypothetical protein